ncbi:hypothetical protein [Parasphingopyxis marina]|uniref:Uncharacterized protein n=1 Tax=Parasphingopyxis marina TaxID=2761622 RepID=A0A842HVR2_9SPHN|nr:hypothetical protein [Parasphingopyxis marina]MBC2776517.1 hypothetical protein [Parasphingopyxis marina]
MRIAAFCALALLAAGPGAAHVETRSFLVTGDEEAVLIVTLPWVATVDWENRATLWTAEGPVALTYEGECDLGFDWRRMEREPGDALLPPWLRHTAGWYEQHGHVGDFLCGNARPAMISRRMHPRRVAERFRALVAAGLRPEPARGIAIASDGAPLVDALTEADVSGALDEARERARAIIVQE